MKDVNEAVDNCMRTRSIATLRDGSKELFFRSYFEKQPVMIPNMILAWPATQRWTPDYLKNRYGEVQVAVARYDPDSGETFLDQTLTDVHHRVPLRQFLSGLENGDHLYAMREDTTLFERAPELLGELAHFSPFVSAATNLLEYKALWIGPPNYVTGLHLDPGDTLLFQLYGRKHVRLFGPDQTQYLYEELVESGAQKFARSALQRRLEPAMFGVLREKVRWCAVQPFSPDLTRFPQFAHADCVEARIGPGDTLYIPDHWWHAVRSVDATISVSIEPDFYNSPFARGG